MKRQKKAAKQFGVAVQRAVKAGDYAAFKKARHREIRRAVAAGDERVSSDGTVTYTKRDA